MLKQESGMPTQEGEAEKRFFVEEHHITNSGPSGDNFTIINVETPPEDEDIWNEEGTDIVKTIKTISQPFNTREEAEAFIRELKGQ